VDVDCEWENVPAPIRLLQAAMDPKSKEFQSPAVPAVGDEAYYGRTFSILHVRLSNSLDKPLGRPGRVDAFNLLVGQAGISGPQLSWTLREVDGVNPAAFGAYVTPAQLRRLDRH
jgi:hypothetical protein